MENEYSLGSSITEQERLDKQRQLYDDSKYLESMLNQNDSVCEVGCGAGANLWIAGKLKHGKYTGIDIQSAQIEASCKSAQLLNLNNTEFYCLDGQILPFEDNTFNLSFCRLLLIHLTDPIRVLSEMNRITKSKGTIVAIDADVMSYKTNKLKLLKCFKARCNYVYGLNKGSINIAYELPQMFEKLELKNINIIKHEIYVVGLEKEKLSQLLTNWLGMINSVVEILIYNQLITKNDYEEAQEEIQNITHEDYIFQPLIVISGIKS